ncbi:MULTISPECIES: MaoC family dehydratase [Kordiimonadales]|uniref:MaoC family dehydratase n=1 Tax=Gimibacter soli TaxID=3024400 RepID=A0AAE9XPH2_9PROT|nr:MULTISPECIES: MaoC family dehydratase [Kordiimonadales]WCL52656.1 MaoC family dehydratase [Gimibacter soli]
MAIVVKPEALNDYIGKETGVSDWFLVDQDRINKFADVTLDHQFIHIDPERAKATPFGTTIAHGFLTLSLLAYLAGPQNLQVEGTVMGINYGMEKLRFLSPVKVNSRIRARVKLMEVSPKPGGRYLLKNEITVDIEGEDKPALITEWLTLIQVAG